MRQESGNMKERKKQEKAHFKLTRAHLGERCVTNFQLEQRREQALEESDNKSSGKFDYSPNFKRILQLRARQKAEAAAAQSTRKQRRPNTCRPRSPGSGVVNAPPLGACERRLWDQREAQKSTIMASNRSNNRSKRPQTTRTSADSPRQNHHFPPATSRNPDSRPQTHRARLTSSPSDSGTDPMNAEIKPQPPKIPFGGPKLRTFKLNGKPEKSTFPQYLVDDGHDKFLEDLSAGAKNNGCHVSLSAQEQTEQDEINRRESLEREKTHASSTGATDDTIHSCEPDLRRKLLKGHVFARGVTDAANPRREFWNNFDMSDPNARRTFYGEVGTAVAMHRHEVVKDPSIEWKKTSSGLQSSKHQSCKPHFKSLLSTFRQLGPGGNGL